MPYVGIRHAHGVPYRYYQAPKAVCQSCPAYGVCTKGRTKGRSVTMGPRDALLRQHRAWMSTDEIKEVYRRRQQLVEPVFGIIKEQPGARRFLLRGLMNVAAEWTVLATAFNMRTLWKAWRRRAFSLLTGSPQSEPTPGSPAMSTNRH